MTDLIRRTREDRGVTARQLADRLGITPGGMSQIEESERAETIKLSTLRRALEALDVTPSFGVDTIDWTSRAAPAAVARNVARELEADRDLHAFRILTDALQQYHSEPGAFSAEQIDERPPRLPSTVWETFFRASYREALGGRAPAWTKVKPLPTPQYLLPIRSLERRADEQTPTYLRELGVLIDERSLSRA